MNTKWIHPKGTIHFLLSLHDTLVTDLWPAYSVDR